MDVYCSFKKTVGGICGPDNGDKKRIRQIVPLAKDIASHSKIDLNCVAQEFFKSQSL